MEKDLNKQKLPGFAERLKAARIAADKTQQDLADVLEISLRNYQRYEVAETEPSLFKLVTLAITLDVTSDFLLGLSDEEPSGEC